MIEGSGAGFGSVPYLVLKDPDQGGPKTYEDPDPEHRFRHCMRLEKDSFRRKLVDKVAEIFRLSCIRYIVLEIPNTGIQI
jgi:hypothetical protein